MPTICRLNGGVYGGSTDLALACDFRIGVDTAEMFMPAARLGLHYYKSGIERYVTRLGVDNAKKLFLTAQKITRARDAADRLSHRDGAGGDAGRGSRQARRTSSPAMRLIAMRGMKRAINEFARGKLDEEAANQRHRESMRGAEIKEGIKAFARKAAAEVLESFPLWEKVRQRTDEGLLREETPHRLRPALPAREREIHPAPTKHS